MLRGLLRCARQVSRGGKTVFQGFAFLPFCAFEYKISRL